MVLNKYKYKKNFINYNNMAKWLSYIIFLYSTKLIIYN